MEKTILKNVKKGEYFTLKPIEYPTEKQVYIRDEYDRSDRRYMCIRFDDISVSRMLPGTKTVYTGFTF